MRILVVNSFFPPRTTGSAHFSLDVAREYVRQGHEVWVATTSVPGAPEREELDGIHVVRIPAWSVTPGGLAFNYALPFVFRPGVIRRVKRLFDQARPDVVHQNGQFFDLTFVTTWVAWRRRVPRVLTVHTPLMHTNPLLRAFISMVDRTALRLLNAPGRPLVVGVDRYVCEMAQRRYRPRRGPVRFIPATLRVDQFSTGDGQRVRHELGLGERPIILSFGHVIPIRSRVPLIRALPHIVEQFPDVRVLVVGEVYYDEFQRLAEQLGVADHLIVTGRVPHLEVPDYLAAATVESHDLDGHGLGITTMEVMAARVPIFARVRRDVFPGIDLDDWPELHIVESAEPHAIADSICHLLGSAAFRKQVADRQFEFVSRYFRAEVVAGRYLELFDELRDDPMPSPTRSAAVRGIAGYFVALLVVVATWAVGVPRFASPDETAHVYKAYGTAHGELLGVPAPGFPDNLREFEGPDSLGPPNLGCYNGQPDVPASCATQISPQLISSAARYPPWYYGLVGVPPAASGLSDRVVAYRLVSAIFCVALLTLAMCLAKRSLRADVVALQLAVLTPMALFLMASVNPNAIEIAGFVAIWACLTRVATDPELPKPLLILASLLSATLVLMRPISILWLVGVVAVVIVGASPGRRRDLRSWRLAPWVIGPTAVALLGSWLWILYSRFEVSDDRLDRTLTLSTALRRSVEAWPTYLRQTIGVLGWLDTSLPSFVYAAWLTAVAVVIFVHFRSSARRGFVAFASLVSVWLALPLVVNGFTNSRAGLTYQGRYSLPIFVGLAFLPMWNDRSTLRWPRIAQRRLLGAVLALVVVAEVGALWQTLRRFTVGANGKIVLTGNLPWEPPVAPMLLVVVNAVAMIALSWSALHPWGYVEAAPGERHGEGSEHGPH